MKTLQITVKELWRNYGYCMIDMMWEDISNGFDLVRLQNILFCDTINAVELNRFFKDGNTVALLGNRLSELDENTKIEIVDEHNKQVYYVPILTLKNTY